MKTAPALYLKEQQLASVSLSPVVEKGWHASDGVEFPICQGAHTLAHCLGVPGISGGLKASTLVLYLLAYLYRPELYNSCVSTTIEEISKVDLARWPKGPFVLSHQAHTLVTHLCFRNWFNCVGYWNPVHQTGCVSVSAGSKELFTLRSQIASDSGKLCTTLEIGEAFRSGGRKLIAQPDFLITGIDTKILRFFKKGDSSVHRELKWDAQPVEPPVVVKVNITKTISAIHSKLDAI